MSAQHKHWWTEFREWRQSRRQPTPQLTTPWQRIPNACPEHPETSMQKVTGPDGLPAWKCPRCGTDAMKPIQVAQRRLPIVPVANPVRILGMAREMRAALAMKPLPPKPALLQTRPDLPKLPPPLPHADVQLTMLPPTRHDLPHMAPAVKQEVFSALRTVPSKPLEAQPVQDTGAIPQDHFLVIGPDALFEPMDKVPTARPLTEAERIAMAAAAEMPRQTTGYLDELATLRHNSDTLEVPAYVKQKHTRESE